MKIEPNLSLILWTAKIDSEDNYWVLFDSELLVPSLGDGRIRSAIGMGKTAQHPKAKAVSTGLTALNRSV